MKRFKNILVVCDEQQGDDSALKRAGRLAKGNNARITIVNVLDSPPGELTRVFGAFPGPRSYDLEFEVLEFHRSRLDALAGRVRSEGVETSDTVLQGIPFVEIIRKVLRDGHDLVVKAAGGMSEGDSQLFGSLDLHLLRKCPCPVWIMKDPDPQNYACVLAAVDPDRDDETRDELNTMVMDLATSLSWLDGSDLHVANAWVLDSEDTLRNSAFAMMEAPDVDRLVRQAKRESKARFDDLLHRYNYKDTKMTPHHLKGPAKQIIPRLARNIAADLVVMGTVGRTGISGLFIGNTAEGILNQVECSVLAVKPPGFMSPVELP